MSNVPSHDVKSIKDALVQAGTPKKGLSRIAMRIATIAAFHNLSSSETQELAVFVADRKPQISTVIQYLDKGYYLTRIIQAYEIRDLTDNVAFPNCGQASLGSILDAIDYFGDAEDSETFAGLLVEFQKIAGVRYTDSAFRYALEKAHDFGNLCYLGDLIEEWDASW